MQSNSKKGNGPPWPEDDAQNILLFGGVDHTIPRLRAREHGTGSCNVAPKSQLRAIDTDFVFAEIDDELYRSGWENPFQGMRSWVTLVVPERSDERVKRRPWDTLYIRHGEFRRGQTPGR